MTPRKIKHARGLAKHEEFMRTVKEGNLEVLQKVRSQREEERKRADDKVKERKIEKSKKLASQHKPLPTQARKKINHKKEN